MLWLDNNDIGGDESISLLAEYVVDTDDVDTDDNDDDDAVKEEFLISTVMLSSHTEVLVSRDVSVPRTGHEASALPCQRELAPTLALERAACCALTLALASGTFAHADAAFASSIHIVPKREFASSVGRGATAGSPKACVVTFDDGDDDISLLFLDENESFM
jgi:hypothetical protein